jgi:hypothetical protein
VIFRQQNRHSSFAMNAAMLLPPLPKRTLKICPSAKEKFLFVRANKFICPLETRRRDANESDRGRSRSPERNGILLGPDVSSAVFGVSPNTSLVAF